MLGNLICHISCQTVGIDTQWKMITEIISLSAHFLRLHRLHLPWEFRIWYVFQSELVIRFIVSLSSKSLFSQHLRSLKPIPNLSYSFAVITIRKLHYHVCVMIMILLYISMNNCPQFFHRFSSYPAEFWFSSLVLQMILIFTYNVIIWFHYIPFHAY